MRSRHNTKTADSDSCSANLREKGSIRSGTPQDAMTDVAAIDGAPVGTPRPGEMCGQFDSSRLDENARHTVSTPNACSHRPPL